MSHPLPVLALDVDGVLLDYIGGFLPWCESRGVRIATREVRDWNMTDVMPDIDDDARWELVKGFSVSPELGDLQPYPGAVEAVAALRRDLPGLRVVSITSAGDTEFTARMRRKSLEVFGLDEITVLPLGASKRDHLVKLPTPSVFVDDLHKHVGVAEDCGHSGILFRRSYNVDDAHPRVISDWEEGVAMMRELLVPHHRSALAVA